MPALELRGIAKKYGKKTVLSDVSFSASPGECLGVIGGNGSGKSTLLSLLAGVCKPDRGSFFWQEKDLFSDPKALRETVGFVPQGTPLFEELTAEDHLKLWYSSSAMKRELQSGILKRLGIDAFLKVRVSRLSGGMKKRLSIGCAMASHPKILLLDEPSAALDLPCKAEIHAYFEAFKKAGGIILLVTHDLQEIDLCDRLYLLKDGKAVVQGAADLKSLAEKMK